MAFPMTFYIKYFTGWHFMSSERRKEETTVLVEGALVEDTYEQDGLVVKLPQPLCISYNNGPPVTTRVVIYPEGRLAAFTPKGVVYHYHQDAPTWMVSRT
jgi:hypothetical protein